MSISDAEAVARAPSSNDGAASPVQERGGAPLFETSSKCEESQASADEEDQSSDAGPNSSATSDSESSDGINADLECGKSRPSSPSSRKKDQSSDPESDSSTASDPNSSDTGSDADFCGADFGSPHYATQEGKKKHRAEVGSFDLMSMPLRRL